jgi:hypothetical protein
MSQAGPINTSSTPLPPDVPLQFTAQDLTIAIPVLNNLNVFGTGGTTTTALGDTLYIHSSATLSGEFDTDVSGPVVPTAGGIIYVTGASNIYSDGSIANTLRLELQGTDNTVFIGQGVNTPSVSSNVGFNGQVLIAATGNVPKFATLTSFGGTISFTPGANTLNLEAGGSVPTTFDEDTGSASPIANVINIVGGVGISTTGSSNTITIDSISSGFTWNVVTSADNPVTILPQNGYICTGIAQVQFTPPILPAVGDTFKIVAYTAPFLLTPNASQTIQIGTTLGQAGATGTLNSNGTGDFLTLVYIGTNNFSADAVQGTFTIQT